MFPELRHAWKLLMNAILIVGVLLSGMALIEVLHAYVILREVHPGLGYGFAGVLLVMLLWLVVFVYRAVIARPRVLVPPRIENREEASETELNLYWTYLTLYLQRLADNPSLPPEEREKAIAARQDLEVEAETLSDRETCIALIRKAEEEVIQPLLRILDELAEEQIRHSVRDIMLAVTLSPFRAADLLVVIYRNAVMVVRVIGIYNSRPLLREQLAIFRDTLRVVAAVNFLSFGEKFTEQLFSRVPFVGQVMDDLIQGIGAGLLTSATGHAALFRCRAFSGWEKAEATQHMARMMGDFLTDTRNMFTKDVLPRVKPRLIAMDAWDRVSLAFTGAFDKTGEIMETFVAKPVVAGGRATLNGVRTASELTFNGVKTAGVTVVTLPIRGAAAVGKTLVQGVSSASSALMNLFGKKEE